MNDKPLCQAFRNDLVELNKDKSFPHLLRNEIYKFMINEEEKNVNLEKSAQKAHQIINNLIHEKVPTAVVTTYMSFLR